MIINDSLLLIDNDGNIAKITPDGRLKVDTLAAIPTAKTEVKITINTILSTTTPVNTYYVIPNGVRLTIVSLEGNTSVSAQGSSISLWYQPNGSSVGEIEITLNIQVNGNNYIKNINWTCPDLGNGIRRIALRRQRNDSTARSVGAEWRGYY
ncbi:MAG: hypothetical protein SNJ64_04160 [Endomicrobiia bacterium]